MSLANVVVSLSFVPMFFGPCASSFAISNDAPVILAKENFNTGWRDASSPQEIVGAWETYAIGKVFVHQYVVVLPACRIGWVLSSKKLENANEIKLKSLIDAGKIEGGNVLNWADCQVANGQMSIAAPFGQRTRYFVVGIVGPSSDPVGQKEGKPNGLSLGQIPPPDAPAVRNPSPLFKDVFWRLPD